MEYATTVANEEILTDVDIQLEPHPLKLRYGNELLASNKLCSLLQVCSKIDFNTPTRSFIFYTYSLLFTCQRKHGVAAVFGPSAPSSTSHCTNICDAKEIPYIDLKWDADTKPPVINMHPHPDTLARVFVDLIKSRKWAGFTIVYESGNCFNFKKTSAICTRERINFFLCDIKIMAPYSITSKTEMSCA